MTCLIAPYSYWFKPQVVALKDSLSKDEYNAVCMQIALDIVAYQDLEDKLERVKQHRIK